MNYPRPEDSASGGLFRPTISTWWGSHEIALDEGLEIEVGPLRVWVVRREREWQVAAERGPDPLAPGASVRPITGSPPENVEWERFAKGTPAGGLVVRPCLLERPFLVRPYAKLQIPPGRRVVTYVSTPVALRLVEGDANVPMVEVPVVTPSETWLGHRGPNDTTQGRVCYAGRTNARFDEAGIELRESRAITAVTVDNQDSEPYWADELVIPVQRLALWTDPKSGALHTDKVRLVHERGSSGAHQVHLEKRPLRRDMTPVAAARESQSGVSVLRMLSNLWEASG